MATPLTAAVVGFHLVKLAGLAVNLAAFPTLAPPSRRPRRGFVALLVPARDEAVNLARTLPGLLAQQADEVLVLDDLSRDDTARVVRDAASREGRLRLLSGTPPPPGWTGKTWACHQLAEATDADLLVFCDADVELAPGALDAVRVMVEERNSAVLSVFPRQLTAGVGERMLVPLIDDVLLSFLPYPLLRLPAPGAAAANGQLLAVTRDAYRRIGGHAAVAGKVVEDLALAHRTRRLGLRLDLALGGDLVRARMYDGYRATVRGFGKSLRAAHGEADVVLAASAAWHLCAYTLPWLLAHGDRAWRAAAVLGLAHRVLLNVKTGRRAPGEALLVPVTPLAALPVYALAFRRTARWKGRRYTSGGHR